MKKLFLVGALALFGAVNAQTTFGVKAGYALSNLKYKVDNSSITTDGKSSFYVGGLVEHKLTDKFALQAELLYADLGGKTTEEESMGGYYVKATGKNNISSLLLPLSAKYFVANAFSLSAGVNVGFVLSAKSKVTVDHNLPSEYASYINSYEGEDDFTDDIKTVNLSPFVGAEYTLSNGLFFDARYNFGVTNMVKKSEYGEKVHLNFFQVGVGYKFK
ncbi:Outer membrane protein beta-barrel domain-containing protein [Epilithonimonas bovis DSM 19482]|jgi:opacity protein-like surface antigen|uniref:Outer membrane protein beta-barrel domain-containing protein n=1 Tax=Epilithonimonas bovis DSM 19482 TaxID=1121284 RepID=A0A1U7PSQ1_9FLAO|nr:porin family protein [Epilithonimonas bovis]SIT96596.1 Outer membrane protein beta-barrel domain-containing protein [Epilithonimonas bovis DSM 19482]